MSETPILLNFGHQMATCFKENVKTPGPYYRLDMQPILLTWINFASAWVSNHMPSKVWDGINLSIYPPLPPSPTPPTPTTTTTTTPTPPPKHTHTQNTHTLEYYFFILRPYSNSGNSSLWIKNLDCVPQTHKDQKYISGQIW